MDDPGKENAKPQQRLCSEIQLFDLCDRESCGHKEGRFCTDQEMLERFERISEEDKPSAARYLDEETEEDDETDFGAALDDDEYADEADGWEDE